MPLGAFILRRLGLGILSMLGVSVLVFLFLHLIPGDPVDHLAGGEATPDQRAKIEQCMGLEGSLPRQYARYMSHVLDGTLGHQCPDPEDKPTVMGRIADVYPHTVALAIAGLVVAMLLALPLGIAAALRRGTWFDTLATAGALSGIAFPMMLLGPLLLLWFFVELGWFPGPFETGAAALVLPAIAVGTHLMALLARMTRSSMVEVLGEDYLRTARAKGLSERVVVWKHALRNAVLPVITVAGLQFGGVLSGAIIIEKVFARPGIGLLLLDGIAERNYPVVQGCVLVIAASYVVVNIAVDIAYGLVDPRIPPRMNRWSPSVRVGAGMLFVFIALGLAGPLLAPHAVGPRAVDLDQMFAPMSSAHWLGTDKSGLDTLSQLLHGARTALLLSLIVVSISATIGVTIGMIAGYFRGVVDDVIMRFVDVLLAFPGLLLNIAIVAVVAKPGMPIFVVALCANGWVGYARIARGQVLSLRERDYVAAARATGASHARVLFRHITPNLLAPLLVQMTLGFGNVIAVEASLSFLGLGPQVDHTWGAMLDQGTTFLWKPGFTHYALAAGLAIAWVVLGANLLGDGLRDRLDPRQRGRS